MSAFGFYSVKCAYINVGTLAKLVNTTPKIGVIARWPLLGFPIASLALCVQNVVTYKGSVVQYSWTNLRKSPSGFGDPEITYGSQPSSCTSFKNLAVLCVWAQRVSSPVSWVVNVRWL